MTHTLRGETRQGRQGIRSSGGVPVYEETYHWIVDADSVTADRLSILNTTGVPKVGVTVSSGGFTVCRICDAVRRPDQVRIWDISATFSSEVDERQATQNVSSDPTVWVPIYETKFERMQENCTRDANGDAVANSAGQPFENGIIRGRSILIWEFFQLEAATVTDVQVVARHEVVNNAEFKGMAVRTLLCTVMSSVIGFYYGSRRRLTRYSLRYNSFNWRQKRLDVGTVYLDGGVHLPYLDDAGNVMLGGLDGAGAKVAPGTIPAILEFDMYPEVAFSSFLRT